MQRRRRHVTPPPPCNAAKPTSLQAKLGADRRDAAVWIHGAQSVYGAPPGSAVKTPHPFREGLRNRRCRSNVRDDGPNSAARGEGGEDEQSGVLRPDDVPPPRPGRGGGDRPGRGPLVAERRRLIPCVLSDAQVFRRLRGRGARGAPGLVPPQTLPRLTLGTGRSWEPVCAANCPTSWGGHGMLVRGPRQVSPGGDQQRNRRFPMLAPAPLTAQRRGDGGPQGCCPG